MRPNGVYALAAERRPGLSLSLRLLILASLLALLWALIPAVGVLAAPSGDDQPWENVDLEKEWKNKLGHLRSESLFFNRVRLDPDDFEKAADFTQAQIYLDKYGFAFRQANTVVFNHAGFDYRGELTDGKQAYETVHRLAMYLQMMRGLRDKIDELDG